MLDFRKIGLLHGDAFPRNMMVVSGEPRDRVLWLDFDCAYVTKRGKRSKWFEVEIEEEMMVDYFVKGIVSIYCLVNLPGDKMLIPLT